MAADHLLTIDTTEQKKPALDFALLRQKGIEYLQALCGGVWTDYNLHDPGVTILEALCYALTDAGYRAEFPISELLANPDGSMCGDEHTFFSREQVLTTNPVTVNDFRKALLDELDNVQNLWLEMVTSQYAPDTIHGLYRITVQVKKEWVPALLEGNGFSKQLESAVINSFVAKRNVCEDVLQQVVILQPLPIRIRAEVMLHNEAVPAQVLAIIYHEIETALNPPVRFFTEKELLEQQYTIEDIYAGPLLKRGFIPDSELKPPKREVDPAELIKAISQVEGVLYVRQLVIETPAGSSSQLPLLLDDRHFAWFNGEEEAQQSIRLFKDKYEIPVNKTQFRDKWLQVQEAGRRSYVPAFHTPLRPPPPPGHYNDISYYHSIQHLFPVMYGISEEGLPVGTPADRRAKAKQLKGYLLFFEQVLANYLAQLANIRYLFSASTSGQAGQTYFYQPLYNVPGIQELLQSFTGQPHQGYLQQLAATAETPALYRERKNKLLDHLLARFNERPSIYPITVYESLYQQPGSDNTVFHEIGWKANLLRNTVAFSRDRIKAFDYRSHTAAFPQSGFSKRMAALLYIPDHSNRRLTDVFTKDGVQFVPGTSEVQTVASETTATAAQELKKQDHFVVRSATEMQQLQEERPLEDASAGATGQFRFGGQKMSLFRYGMDPTNYTIGPAAGGQGWLLLYKEPAAAQWQVISRHTTKAGAIRALDHLTGWLRQVSLQSEGFYIVEHILLRPLLHMESFGFRFLDANNDLLLQHNQWSSFMQREQAIAQLLQQSQQGNLTAQQVKQWQGLCRVQLNDKPEGRLEDPGALWTDEIEAQFGTFQHIQQQLQSFHTKTTHFYPRFEMLVKGPGNTILHEGFFNFNMTVVLPAWPSRFQDYNFRLFLEDLFRVQAPAHVRVNFLWLNIRRMQVFEELYTGWTNALQQDDSNERRLWSEQMITFLR